MALIATKSASVEFKPAPQGVFTARCYRVIDLGTQEKTFQGVSKGKARKVLIGWELFGEDEDGHPLMTDEGKPVSVTKRYTVSLGDKAKLRSDLESWRGRAFTEDELAGFDLKNLLGVYALINVKHDIKPEAIYANVASISPIPKQMRASLPEGFNELQFFDVEEPDMGMFSTFSEKLRLVISASEEFKARANPHKHTEMPDNEPSDPDGDVAF